MSCCELDTKRGSEVHKQLRKKPLPHGRTPPFNNFGHLLQIAFLKREGPAAIVVWAHSCPWQPVENHFAWLTGICSYIGTKRMAWLSSNCCYEWHPRLQQRPLVILGKGYGLAKLELGDLLGTVARDCATMVQSVQDWQYKTYLGKGPWYRRALPTKARDVHGHHITNAVRWDLGEHWGQWGAWKWATSFHSSCRLASQRLIFLI